MRLNTTILMLLALTIGICMLALKQFRLPAPSGPYEVGTRFLFPSSIDKESHSGKPLVVRIWYPAAPSSNPVAFYRSFSGGPLRNAYLSLLKTGARSEAPPLQKEAPFPILLFAHRWGGQDYQNTLLAEDLASHGYMVASMDYFSDPSLTMSDAGLSHGGANGQSAHDENATKRIALWNEVLDLWASDESSMLDRLIQMNAEATDPLHGLLDTKNVGAFGHSFGGAAALRLCGLDPRVHAAANLDGWSFGALKDRDADEPILIMYEHAVMTRRKALLKMPDPGSIQDETDRTDNKVVDESLRKFGGYRMYVTDSQHMDFSDAPFLPLARFRSSTGPIQTGQIRTIVGKTVLEFFDQSLRNKPSSLLSAPQKEFPEVVADSWVRPLS